MKKMKKLIYQLGLYQIREKVGNHCKENKTKTKSKKKTSKKNKNYLSNQKQR